VTSREPEIATMRQVVDALADLYTDDGVAIWLDSPNRMLQGQRGIDVCRTAEGRYRVYALAQALADGAFA